MWRPANCSASTCATCRPWITARATFPCTWPWAPFRPAWPRPSCSPMAPTRAAARSTSAPRCTAWISPRRPAWCTSRAGPALQRHKAIYGTTDEQFGMLAVGQRQWAAHNPNAIFTKPLSMDDYLAQPYLVAPLRRADITMISDGGVAIVVTTAERARELRQPAVYISGIAEHAGIRGEHNPENLMRPWLREAAGAIWAATGLGPDDIDALYIQDPTALWSLQMLEYYGFCGLGEGGPFLAEGHTLPGGRLPLNTHGGQLSESYSWGWMHLVEAARQP